MNAVKAVHNLVTLTHFHIEYIISNFRKNKQTLSALLGRFG